MSHFVTDAWTQLTSYWECPHCQETACLGEDLSFNGPMNEECERCGAVVTVNPPKEGRKP